MTDLPLSPHQEQFIREQLASGRFHSERDLITAALELLEQHSSSLTKASGKSTRAPSQRRSPRGILADLRSYIGPEEIKEVRKEMWAGLSEGNS